jgi:hypothetical protein
MPDAVATVVCAPVDGWKYHPKHVEQFPEINKLCNVASCWVEEYNGILLGARPILHISRIKVNMIIAPHVSGVVTTHPQEHNATASTASGKHYTLLLSAAIVGSSR